MPCEIGWLVLLPGVGGVEGAERKLAPWLSLVSVEVLGVRPRLPGILIGVKAGDQLQLFSCSELFRAAMFFTGLSLRGVMLSRLQGENGTENLSGLKRKLCLLEVTGEEVEARSEVLSGKAASSVLVQTGRKGLWWGSGARSYSCGCW